MQIGLTLRAGLVSLLLFGAFVGAWHLATAGSGPAVKMDPEYAKLMGATATQGKSAMPGPADVAAKIWQHLRDPFYDRGTNDKGIGIQLAYCFGLKHQAVLDICIVSSAYLIRAIAGGVAANIPLSQWFLLVMTFGSLFMVAGKRYAELQLSEKTGAKIRKSLESYTSTYLRFVWTLSATAMVVCYGLWAFERDGANASWYAITMIPFTIAILRYAVDVDGGMAGEPEEIALKDRVLQLLALAWIGTIGAAVFLS